MFVKLAFSKKLSATTSALSTLFVSRCLLAECATILGFTAIMIKPALGAKEFAFPAVQRSAAVDTEVPVMLLRPDLNLFDFEVQQRRNLSDFILLTFHALQTY